MGERFRLIGVTLCVSAATTVQLLQIMLSAVTVTAAVAVVVVDVDATVIAPVLWIRMIDFLRNTTDTHQRNWANRIFNT